MKTGVYSWTEEQGWAQEQGECDEQAVDLVLYFGAPGTLDDGARYNDIQTRFPNAILMGCSTGGEIVGDEVLDDSVVVSAMQFDNTAIEAVQFEVQDVTESENIGQRIGEALNAPDLKNIFILSDGLNINGTDLVNGVTSAVSENVIVTGGLAGDGADFGNTIIGLNQVPTAKHVAAVGFYGNAVSVSYGSVGGWNRFGPERTITKSKDNILFELDGQPALDLYKKYLGDEADKLPGSGLLYPLSVRPNPDSQHSMTRTIVGIDEEANSLIFAGDVPEGYTAQLMRGNFDNLVDGAAKAAEMAAEELGECEGMPAAVMVSCIGRNLLMGQRISDEAESVKDILGDNVANIGFYSYGEICPHAQTAQCGLHNQTMTITLIGEQKTAA